MSTFLPEVVAAQRLGKRQRTLRIWSAACASGAEAYTIAGKGGVDRDVLTQVLATGGGDSVVLKRLIPFIEEGDPSGFMFSMVNACKDMRYLTHMAEDLQVGVPAAETLHQTFITAANVGGDERLVPELIDILGGMHGAPLCKK